MKPFYAGVWTQWDYDYDVYTNFENADSDVGKLRAWLKEHDIPTDRVPIFGCVEFNADGTQFKLELFVVDENGMRVVDEENEELRREWTPWIDIKSPPPEFTVPKWSEEK